MTSIVIYEFGGMIPRSGDDYLPDEHASDAANCVLLSGDLEPLHQPSLVNNFYPALSHQERVDRFGPLPVDPDPDAIYNGCLVQVLGESPIVWIRGFNSMENDGTGSSYDWNPFGLRQDPTVDAEGWINFVGIAQEWMRTEVETGQNNWFLSAPPSVTLNRAAPDGPAIVNWPPTFNIAAWNSTVDCFGNTAGDIVFGWPCSWNLDWVVDAPLWVGSNQFIRITEGNFPGGRNIALSSTPVAEKFGGLNASDNVYSTQVEITLENTITTSGADLSENTHNYVMQGFNPSRGPAGANDLLDNEDFTINFALRYNLELPGFVEIADREQVIFSAGGFYIIILKTGEIEFRVHDAATDEFFTTGYFLVQGQEAWCTLTFNVGLQEYNFYVDGVLEATYSGTDNPNFSIGAEVFFGAVSIAPAGEFPIASTLKQFWYDNTEIIDTEVFTLWQASQGIPCS